MITPRSHQRECLKTLKKERLAGIVRALVVMASGLGKTVTAAFDVQRWLKRNRGQRVLYLCHQNDILEQAQLEFAKVLGWKKADRYAFFHGADKQRAHEADIVFASFQTMREWRSEFKKGEFSYIVVDESHHTHAPTYRPTLEYFQPRFLLGITATPDRMDFQDIREIYGQEVFNLPLEEALSRGLLAKVDYRLVTDELANLSILDTPIGRLSIRDLNRTLFVPKRDKEIAKLLESHIGNEADARVMIFCRTTQHCDRLAKKIPGALAIHYRLGGAEQRLRLKTFREGGARIVLTVDKFNEGIDIPEANIIVFLRSTDSETIFLQQLGRGLRKAHGKEKVLVLDFVGNCERLEMVHDLWNRVGERLAKQASPAQPAFEVNVGKVEFTEVAKRVLDVLAGIRTGYTREMLIQQLQRLAEKLGKTPSWRDVHKASKRGECASGLAFQRYFVTFNRALVAAGLPINKRDIQSECSEEVLLQQLRDLASKLGRTPTYRDIVQANKKGECENDYVFTVFFGGLNAAYKAAGLLSRKIPFTRMSKANLAQHLHNLSVELGKPPTLSDINEASSKGKCASASLFQKRFGSIADAREAAGLPRGAEQQVPVGPKMEKAERKEMIRQLQTMAKILGRTPTVDDVKAAHAEGTCASIAAFFQRFRSFNKAKKAAGLAISKGGQPLTRDVLVAQLKALTQELGRAPTFADIARASKQGKCACEPTFKKLFGNLSHAFLAAGLEPSPTKSPVLS